MTISESDLIALYRERNALKDRVAELESCTHCYEPSCPNYNGPAGWDKREQYS